MTDRQKDTADPDPGFERNVFRIERVPWSEPSGHVGGLSKYLVSPDTHDSRFFDFRISRYPIGGFVEPHIHQTAEHVYYFLSGTGLIRYGDSERIVEPATVMFVPPGVVHAISNTGESDLVFIVATSPPSDIRRDRRSSQEE